MLKERSYTQTAQQNAKLLRRDMTPQEKKLWYEFLRTFRPKFQRQRAIGSYIVDFYCASAGLVVELDGAQHYTEENFAADEQRTKFLNAKGLRVLRFLNRGVVSRFPSVCATIESAVHGDLEGRYHSV